LLEAALADMEVHITTLSDPQGSWGAGDLDSRFRDATPTADRPSVESVVRANRALSRHMGDFVLLVDVGAPLRRSAVDLLVLVARRFPWAGIYGARRLDHPIRAVSRGPTSQRATFARASERVAPGRRKEPRIRARGKLDRGLVLINASLWTALGGFDECAPDPYAPDGICTRARSKGFTPLEVSLPDLASR